MIDVACAIDYLHHADYMFDVEYGLGGLVSTSSDVYSYGIMLMETFTRTKPTDEIFGRGMTLRLWVKESLPNEVIKVVDMDLLRQGEEHLTKDVRCLTSIMELALECTKEPAEERLYAAESGIMGTIPYEIVVLSSITLAMTFVFVLIRCRKSKRVPTEIDMQSIVHRRTTYHEIFEATNGFRESNLIGNGSFVSVYKGVFPDEMVVAIMALNSFHTECELLHNIRHRNLTKGITSCSNLDFRALVLKYMPNRSLEKLLHSQTCCLGFMQRNHLTTCPLVFDRKAIMKANLATFQRQRRNSGERRSGDGSDGGECPLRWRWWLSQGMELLLCRGSADLN
ncbi:hypothetical protein RJ640_002474 [Escallonia rubra]|uniref:Serine-threonine/tyrosine-protein kinase catalytic domain-containing protein n=1 Tax=Escallonia rubra TaxID=112253 RepID=A0AA88QYK0_9ASTE|nr:hypothetical protein RJ640_002474 [Escallonia rubra]